MIPIEKLRQIKHGIFHASCPDGVASALIVKDALPDVRVSFVKYGSEEHRSIEPAPDTLFCDFSPWLPPLPPSDVSEKYRERMWAARIDAATRWRDAGVIVLDHHSLDVVEPYGELGIFGENDKLQCGAWLAYEHVWLPLLEDLPQVKEVGLRSEDYLRVREFAERAAVRDTWRQKDARFQQALKQGELLLFWGSKQPLDYYLGAPDKSISALAARLFERAEEHARTAISEAVRFTSAKGTRVLVFQGVSATSDATELLEKEEGGPPLMLQSKYQSRPVQMTADTRTDLVVGFHYRVDAGKLALQFSTRSHTGFDCQALARAHGGNGHKAAAGFTVSEGLTGNPYETFRILLDHWEDAR